MPYPCRPILFYATTRKKLQSEPVQTKAKEKVTPQDTFVQHKTAQTKAVSLKPLTPSPKAQRLTQVAIFDVELHKLVRLESEARGVVIGTQRDLWTSKDFPPRLATAKMNLEKLALSAQKDDTSNSEFDKAKVLLAQELQSIASDVDQLRQNIFQSAFAYLGTKCTNRLFEYLLASALVGDKLETLTSLVADFSNSDISHTQSERLIIGKMSDEIRESLVKMGVLRVVPGDEVSALSKSVQDIKSVEEALASVESDLETPVLYDPNDSYDKKFREDHQLCHQAKIEIQAKLILKKSGLHANKRLLESYYSDDKRHFAVTDKYHDFIQALGTLLFSTCQYYNVKSYTHKQLIESLSSRYIEFFKQMGSTHMVTSVKSGQSELRLRDEALAEITRALVAID